MADAPTDAEASPVVDDRQPLLANRDSLSEAAPSTSILQSVVQWSQTFRIMPVLTRASSGAPSPAAQHHLSSARQASPTAQNTTFASSSPQNGSPAPSSPSVGRVQTPKSARKNDLETAALRRINSICSEGSMRRTNGACIICMETLTPEEFASGEAITLECMCKGEMALRHKSCAEKWAQVKGSNVCDVCKAPIANLPPLPEPDDLEVGLGDVITVDMGDHFEAALTRRDEIPAAADYIFDCIRVTWVSMIICILFFEFPVSKSFVTGLMVGVAYTAFCKAMHRSAQYRALAATPDSPPARATMVMA